MTTTTTETMRTTSTTTTATASLPISSVFSSKTAKNSVNSIADSVLNTTASTMTTTSKKAWATKTPLTGSQKLPNVRRPALLTPEVTRRMVTTNNSKVEMKTVNFSPV